MHYLKGIVISTDGCGTRDEAIRQATEYADQQLNRPWDYFVPPTKVHEYWDVPAPVVRTDTPEGKKWVLDAKKRWLKNQHEKLNKIRKMIRENTNTALLKDIMASFYFQWATETDSQFWGPDIEYMYHPKDFGFYKEPHWIVFFDFHC